MSEGNWFDLMAWCMGPSQLVGSKQDSQGPISVDPPSGWGMPRKVNHGENLGRIYLLNSLLRQMSVPRNRYYDLPWLASHLATTEAGHPLFHVVLEVLSETLNEFGCNTRIEDKNVVYVR